MNLYKSEKGFKQVHVAGTDPGRGGALGAHASPPSGLCQRKTQRFTAQLAHVATLTQRTSLYESLLHVLHT